ncbi:hypothetical protein [Streptomyces ochraceiscleroticus]|uniref:Roadblock/LAMTOR2 domain-containing protein n=1 Tax=Streptomyces ochraceiscleroticus TaxID=47761 RepID=A0ABW1MWP6_9ACTN|nr:hypothetical protein [Streptomyces ochraceiscleroticus]
MPGIEKCLLHAMELPGARGAAIVDWISGLALGTVGEPSGADHETTAAETAELARMAAEYSAFAPAGPDRPDKEPPVQDLILITRTDFHLIRFVETTFDSSVFLHLWLDRDTGNLALARIRLQSIAERLVLG